MIKSMSDSGIGAGRRTPEVLLVDDSLGCILLAEEAFEAARTPIRLSVAGSGEEALGRLRREGEFRDHPRPDLVLLDRNLPRMDGQSVLQAIRSDPSLHSLPVVMMSGSSAVDDISDSYAAGANAYIVKPGGYERLTEIVEAIRLFWFEAASLPIPVAQGKAHAA